MKWNQACIDICEHYLYFAKDKIAVSATGKKKLCSITPDNGYYFNVT